VDIVSAENRSRDNVSHEDKHTLTDNTEMNASKFGSMDDKDFLLSGPQDKLITPDLHAIQKRRDSDITHRDDRREASEKYSMTMKSMTALRMCERSVVKLLQIANQATND